MDGARTHACQSVVMLGGAVFLMVFKAVPRIADCRSSHHSIACDFGYNRRGGDAEAQGITVNDGGLRHVEQRRRTASISTWSG